MQELVKKHKLDDFGVLPRKLKKLGASRKKTKILRLSVVQSAYYNAVYYLNSGPTRPSIRQPGAQSLTLLLTPTPTPPSRSRVSSIFSFSQGLKTSFMQSDEK